LEYIEGGQCDQGVSNCGGGDDIGLAAGVADGDRQVSDGMDGAEVRVLGVRKRIFIIWRGSDGKVKG
jgi:hypothetical protein